MLITHCDDYAKMSKAALSLLEPLLRAQPQALVCAATGASPIGLYQEFALLHQQDPLLTSALRILKLDEWGGIPMDDPNSCESFLALHLLRPLSVSPDRYFAFESDPPEPEKECERIQKIIGKSGPIDCCILGLGKNGHLGFNEPGSFLFPDCHVAALTPTTMQHSMATAMHVLPRYGLTIGMKDILQSRMLILLVSGAGKAAVTSALLQRQVSSQLPASFLWLHPNAYCLIDRSAGNESKAILL